MKIGWMASVGRKKLLLRMGEGSFESQAFVVGVGVYTCWGRRGCNDIWLIASSKLG